MASAHPHDQVKSCLDLSAGPPHRRATPVHKAGADLRPRGHFLPGAACADSRPGAARHAPAQDPSVPHVSKASFEGAAAMLRVRKGSRSAADPVGHATRARGEFSKAMTRDTRGMLVDSTGNADDGAANARALANARAIQEAAREQRRRSLEREQRPGRARGSGPGPQSHLHVGGSTTFGNTGASAPAVKKRGGGDCGRAAMHTQLSGAACALPSRQGSSGMTRATGQYAHNSRSQLKGLL